jgi:hypothetical protein
MASAPRRTARGGGSSRTPSRSPAKSGADELAAGLSTKMGDLLLTEKEASSLVISGAETSNIPRPRWAVVGKVCSPRKLVIGALERAMLRAWGLHRAATFRDIGDNRFVVRFSSEGDWKHVMKKGPWQFDFNAILLKDLSGLVRPSDMVFDSIELWARVCDLPMDMMNRAHGKLFGNWIGKYIYADVDEDGIAWGKDLRIRVEVRVEEPLLRGISVRNSEDDVRGNWFDVQYERVPHFCFDCRRLVHPNDFCPADRDEEKQQWGGWLRASPGRSYKPVAPARPSVTSGSYGSRSLNSDSGMGGGVSIRDVPPRRNLAQDFSYSSSSRTGGHESFAEMRRESTMGTCPENRHRAGDNEQRAGKAPMAQELKKDKRGTFLRKPRKVATSTGQPKPSVPLGTKKRGPKQMWMPVSVQVIGEGTAESVGKRQRTTSVFDRMEEPTDGHAGQRTSSVFDRLEDPTADPATQGRRSQ